MFLASGPVSADPTAYGSKAGTGQFCRSVELESRLFHLSLPQEDLFCSGLPGIVCREQGFQTNFHAPGLAHGPPAAWQEAAPVILANNAQSYAVGGLLMVCRAALIALARAAFRFVEKNIRKARSEF